MKTLQDYPDYFYLGKVIRPHGVKGAVKIYLDVDNPSEYRDLDVVFVELKRNLVPYFIGSIHLEENKANLKLQDLHSIDEAQRLSGCRLFLPLDKLPKLKGNKFYYHEVIGFTVVDSSHGNIGSIENILDLPNNTLMTVASGKREILIPVNDDIILKVDRKSRTIRIKAPEGLIDIYD